MMLGGPRSKNRHEGRKKLLRGSGGLAYKAPPDANDAGAAEPAATDTRREARQTGAYHLNPSGSVELAVSASGGFFDKFIPCCEKGCAGGGSW
ncbi:hypothetical protein, partial [Azospirillum sp. TSO5]|uniref:hypothetical protein n=1 Tax=Azospirillum sp. TSO5 TaxID=716760 RepID=UPI001B3B817B